MLAGHPGKAEDGGTDGYCSKGSHGEFTMYYTQLQVTQARTRG